MIKVKQKNICYKLCTSLLLLIITLMCCLGLAGCAQEEILYDTDILLNTKYDSSVGYTFEWEMDIFNNTEYDKENVELTIYFNHQNKLVKEVYVIDKIYGETWKTISGEFIENSYYPITIESVSYEINGAKFTAGEYSDSTFNTGMGIFFGGLLVMLIVIAANAKKNKESTKGSRSISMKHNECEINSVGDNCLHIDIADDYDVKVCGYCGYHNEKKAKKCSVCGNRLPLF